MNGRKVREAGMTRNETIDGLQERIDRNKNTLLPRVHIGYLIHAVKYLKIVRCKDCILRFTNKCVLHDQAFPVNKGDDWFCADGERK